ncbi:MAG: family 78 glycoside hydrolase catalytic domain [Clostridia bacterium]|nr:family 78 glycoside hydrolase catalytic domain [Clostridia bacterium]
MLPVSFIKATDEYCDFDRPVNAPLFRRSFTLDTVPNSVLLNICVMGFYELYINGHRITKGALAPYIANPDDIAYYDRYDITAYLKEGINAVGVMLGNGFFNPFGGKVWNFDKAAWRGPLRLALSVEADGKELFSADDSFRVAPSPITFDDIRIGTFYDATQEIEGWASPEFDDSAWKHATPAEAPKGEKRLCEAEPVIVYRELKPMAITHYDDFCFCCGTTLAYRDPIEETRVRDTWLYDFGENNTGVCRLKIRGKRGQTVTLRFMELVVDGYPTTRTTLNVAPERTWHFVYPQMDRYTLKGDGEEEYIPPFTYHGFRYVLVEGITPEQATPDLLTYRVMSCDMKDRAAFSCSDERLNRLFDMTRRSDRSNFLYIPTDCPQREKNGWTADAALSSEHMLLTMTAENAFREWLRNVCKAQREDGALPGIVPTGGWGFAWGNGPAWDCVCVIVPYYCYRYTGDPAIITECADTIDRYLHYIAGRRDDRGLLAVGLGDWVQPLCPDQKFLSPLEFTDSATTLDMARKAAFLFRVIGEEEKASFADQLAQELRAAIREHLIDTDTCTAIGDCQTGQVLSMVYNIFEPHEMQTAFDRLLEFIHQADDHLLCGVLGARHLFHLLAQYDKTDLALHMITRPDGPSYGQWLLGDDTTLREIFETEGIERQSQNHHFWGDIISFFIQELVGIKPNPHLRDRFELEVSPAIAESLTFAKASYILPTGTFVAEWHRTDTGIDFTVTVPPKAHGSFRVPHGYEMANGVKAIDLTPGTVTYSLKKSL